MALLSKSEILQWLREDRIGPLRELYARADAVRKQNVGDAVHLRGLIEISSHCRRQCMYCGLREANRDIERYRICLLYTSTPAFGKQLGDVECVNCGQCASVCPTGALTPKSEVDEVWSLLADPEQKVVVQVAPAVRVGLGECFGLKPGDITTGQIAAALRRLGFDQVYDTSFAADLTVVEESTEFLKRKQEGGKLPMFTSCCPGWVKYAEQYFPDLLPNLSSCRSPQAMFGSLIKAMAPEQLKVDRKNVKVVAIMPCTAKKFEAQRPELGVDGDPDVDLSLIHIYIPFQQDGGSN